MGVKFDGKKRLVLAIAICSVCFFCMGLEKNDNNNTGEPVSTYETFSGKIYDQNRLEPVDMSALIEQYQGQSGHDKKLLSHQKGWRFVIEGGQYGFRHYLSRGEYALGWQYLERDGLWDWYYFDENTGLLVSNTILDGVVLSRQGHAVAVTAKTANTLEAVNDSAHCNEVLLAEDILADEAIVLTKEMILVSQMEETSVIRRAESENVDDGSAYLIETKSLDSAVIGITGEGAVTLGSGIKVLTDQAIRNGIVLTDGGELSCYGFVGSDTALEARYGIAAVDEDTKITIYASAQISGAETGIYSEGNTWLIEEQEESGQGNVFSGSTVHAATVSSGKMISGNSDHGVTQNGGTLTMKGGTIFNNGTLGSEKKTGSSGGGVYLKNKAVMNMSGGTVSGNRASYGGGIYVSSGCTLNITGGTIGGTKTYESKDTNTTANGNYAREHRRSGGGKKYARGSGGGIYSEGTVNINGKNTVNISYNTSKGPGGAGGILVYAGTTCITGNVNINNNKAWHSDAESSAQVASGDPNGEGAGIRVGYDVTKNGAKCLINCSNKEGYPVTSGTVTIKNNQASGDGGGIYVSNGTNHSLIIKGKTYIQNNISQGSGGGGVKTLGGDLWLYNVVISGNTAAKGKGGGIQTAGKTYLNGCKIYGNTTDQEGGGIVFYASTVGTVGYGTVYNSAIYDNTSVTGAAGIEVRDSASALINAGTRVYDNCAKQAGIRCTQKATLTLEGCYVYGNGSYGLENQGTTIVNGAARIGFSSYVSDKEYTADQNAGGGIYNKGTFTVNAGKELRVYGGASYGLYNDGTALFKDTSTSSLLGEGASAIIKNTGTLTAVGADSDNVSIATVIGRKVINGIDNDGGTIKWSGRVTGADTGILNQNGGEATTYGECQIYGCKTAVHNKQSSVAHISGSYSENTQHGLHNEGELHLGTVGNTTISLMDSTGIYNSGLLYGDQKNEYYCLVTGEGTGIRNEGLCFLGRTMEIESAEMEERIGIFNATGGQLYMTGGNYLNSSKHGIYCERDSQFYMGRAAKVDSSNSVFLEPGCYININQPLTSIGTIAKIDTAKDSDRFPGRVVAKVTYLGGTGKRELYHGDGNQKFLLAYSEIDGGGPAILADGSRINTVEEVDITERDIYVSTYYPVTFDSGYKQIAGAISEDVIMSQTDQTKYWMEDLALDLMPPTLINHSLINTGWKYLYWEGDNNTIYSRPSEVYSENRPLVLTARWKRNAESNLEAWLYDRSAWLRNQMQGAKSDEQYKYFLAGDTGVITFSCVNLTEVSVVWPSTGSADQLKTYDKEGQFVRDRMYQIASLTEDISQTYENSSYQFRVPVGTPAGIYYVTVIGTDQSGQQWTCTLSLIVGDRSISSTIRTRIR